jgi:hypothetical protein
MEAFGVRRHAFPLLVAAAASLIAGIGGEFVECDFVSIWQRFSCKLGAVALKADTILL